MNVSGTAQSNAPPATTPRRSRRLAARDANKRILGPSSASASATPAVTTVAPGSARAGRRRLFEVDDRDDAAENLAAAASSLGVDSLDDDAGNERSKPPAASRTAAPRRRKSRSGSSRSKLEIEPGKGGSSQVDSAARREVANTSSDSSAEKLGSFVKAIKAVTFAKVKEVSPRRNNKQLSTSTTAKYIFQATLEKSPHRELSNLATEDTSRQNLGANGTLSVYYDEEADRNVFQYHNAEGAKVFEAKAPLAEEAWKEIQGNCGVQDCIIWQAFNTSFKHGGTSIEGADTAKNPAMCRRHYFWFNNKYHFFKALCLLLNNDDDLMEQFFDPKSKFYAAEQTRPPHPVILPPDAMEGCDDHLSERTPSKTPSQCQKEFGNDPFKVSCVTHAGISS